MLAAHAAEVVLDAVARSSGTRPSVVEELFATDAPDGLTGPVGFDERGDLEQATVTIMRVTTGKGSSNILSVEGAEVEQVVRLGAPTG